MLSLSSIEEKILGPREEFELNRRLACFIAFMFLPVCVISVVVTFICNFPTVEIYFQILLTLTTSILYYLYRFKLPKHTKYWGLIICCHVYFTFMYFTNGGLRGPVLLYGLIIFISVLIIAKKRKWVYYVLFNLNIIVLILIQQLFPELIVRFDEKIMNLLLIMSIFICISFLYLIIQIVIKKYNDEQEKVLDQKEAIEQQSNRIRELMDRDALINQMKLNFFTNVSHEFRTPLTLLAAPLELLTEKEKDTEKLKVIKTIQTNAVQLKKLVDQILDLRKLDSGDLQLILQKKDVARLVQSTVQSFAAHAEVQKIDLRFFSHCKGGLIMAFDPEKLEKLVSNILLNAFKYTSAGGIIKVEVKPREDMGAKFVEIKITDTGKGIPEKFLNDIFKPFYQVPGTMYGTGLGLTLANQYAQLHYGTIMVESQEGKGTLFTILIPAEIEKFVNEGWIDAVFDHGNTETSRVETVGSLPVKKDNNDDTPDWYRGEDDKQYSLLIVDDNVEFVNFIYRFLHNEYKIFKAFDGKEGFEKAIEFLPDIILSDIMMPEIDGIELCNKLKTNENTSHIPFILLTAKAGETNKINGLDTGADDYITKPFSINELKARINNLIRIREILREKFQNNLLDVKPKDVTVTLTDEMFLKKAIESVEKNMLDSQFGVMELTNIMNVSRSLLHLKLKKITNLSASQFIAAIRLRVAAHLLKSTNESITEICYRTGFSTPAYFSACFKEQFGISPTDFRNKN